MSDIATAPMAARISTALNRATAYAGYAWEMFAPVWNQLQKTDSRSRHIDVNGLTVRCDHSLPDDSATINAWEDLYRRCPLATPFHSPAWQSALLETPAALRRLRLFTVYDKQRLIGVLPLETRLGKILHTSGAMLTDYLDPLIDPDYAGDCWSSLLRGVVKLQPGRTLVLENVREETQAPNRLNDCAAAAGFELVESNNCPVARIHLPRTWDQYLASLDGHERKELRRKIKKAEQQGGAYLRVCSDPRNILDDIAGMFDLIESTGGGKARKAKWLFPRHFHSSARELAASGRLVLYKLIVQDRYAAGMIALPTKQGQILWNTAFDHTMKAWSPGMVLFAMLIRRSIEKGHTVFDLLRGQNDYKLRLGAAEHPLRRLTFKPA